MVSKSKMFGRVTSGVGEIGQKFEIIGKEKCHKPHHEGILLLLTRTHVSRCYRLKICRSLHIFPFLDGFFKVVTFLRVFQLHFS